LGVRKDYLITEQNILYKSVSVKVCMGLNYVICICVYCLNSFHRLLKRRICHVWQLIFLRQGDSVLKAWRRTKEWFTNRMLLAYDTVGQIQLYMCIV